MRASTACTWLRRNAGVGEATVYRWLERAEDPKAPAKFRDFRAALARANADAEVGAIAVIRAAMPGDWRAALGFLKLRFPERWSERQRLEHSGRQEEPIRRDVVDAEVERLAAEVRRRSERPTDDARA